MRGTAISSPRCVAATARVHRVRRRRRRADEGQLPRRICVRHSLLRLSGLVAPPFHFAGILLPEFLGDFFSQDLDSVG
jgi:hypothetical protein